MKKILSSLVAVAILAIVITIPNAVYATTLQAGQEVYMGIKPLMENNEPHMGYAINTPPAANAEKIWNIVRYKASSAASGYTNPNLYCLKAGVGFTAGIDQIAPYNVYFDMKKERSEIEKQNELLRQLVNGTITENGVTISRYNAVLAVLDMLYLPGESTVEEKEQLLDAIIEYGWDLGYTGSYMDVIEERAPENLLTDNDINAVQQAVLWYFTNYGENDKSYNKINDGESWLNYTFDGDAYDSLVNYNPSGVDTHISQGQLRAYQAKFLYNYMISQAKAKANEYENVASMTGSPIRVDTTTLGKQESGDNYIIGPFHMTQLNVIPYNMEFIVKNNGNEITNYTLLNENKKVLPNGTTVKSLVGKDFYISLPKSQVNTLSVDININYNEKTMKLWASTKNNLEQPLAEVNKTSKKTTVTLTLERERPFDLALRKYITKVNGVELTGANSRIPNIDVTTLTTGTTATYKHRKDPVSVENGDKVTYKMTIYNEGEKAGRPTKVVDQLPTGLHFDRIVSGNFDLGNYDETTNTLNLVRKSGNTTNLLAYKEGYLVNSDKTGTETIEIECTVTAKPDTTNSQILTNVAWIAEEIDENNNVITTERGKDRDSEPGTKPNVNKDNMGSYKGKDTNKDNLADSNYHYEGQQDDDDFEKLILEPKAFDLSLRKYITKVNGVELTGSNSRIPNVDVSTLANGTTATYKHKKDPVTIAQEDVVTYKMTIYNEGEQAGRATKVVDQLPEGLQFKRVVSGNFDLGNYEEETNTLNLVRKTGNNTNLPAYKAGNLVNNGTGTETIEIECIVTAKADTNNDKVLTNVAWIAEEVDERGTVITTERGKDRDSEPGTKPNVNKDNMENYKGKDTNKEDLADSNYHYEGQQDDDDFEKLILLPEAFDLKLIKRITAVNDEEVPERIESIDASKLNTKDANGNMITTADYQLNKEPVAVKKGDIVTYTFRIYNEGTIDGYAQEISEDIPEGLEFIWSEKEGEELKADTTLTDDEKEAIEFNQKYLWGNFQYDENKEKIITISSDYLSRGNETTVKGNLIKAFGRNDGTKTEKDLSYKELAVKFKVVSDNVTGTIIKNEAAITDDSNENGDSEDDRDSIPEDWKEHPDHEDDEDHDYIILQSFDLALRKFIIAISGDTKIEDSDYLKNQDGSYTRAPVVDTSKLNTLDENENMITTATYNHTKEPVMVKPNDIVVYMLRVYNEGDIDGYASEIKDHLPPYLEFVEGDFNEKYGWEVSEDGRTVTTRHLEDSIISKTKTDENGKIVLSYKEVPIMCKVSEKPKTSENITNIADITEYLDNNKKPTTDRDSQIDNVKLPEDKDLPAYKEEEKGSYVPGQQDDDDFEKVIVKIFDLALRKWVTQAIVIENGEQTITQTGHDAWDDPEAVVKVELHRKKLNQVTVKFRYSIRVYNQGEIEGYAKEVTDYIPEGLKFVAEDNPGWTDEGNNVISTRLLENTLLKPGEYADVEVVLTWINSENNMGVMTNTAEISEDYNEYDVPDIDSTPDNQKPGEDDIDDAPVMLSITTGQIRIYFTLGFIVLVTIAGGVVLIKKFVL